MPSYVRINAPQPFAKVTAELRHRNTGNQRSLQSDPKHPQLSVPRGLRNNRPAMADISLTCQTDPQPDSIDLPLSDAATKSLENLLSLSIRAFFEGPPSMSAADSEKNESEMTGGTFHA